jgi:hypothetical protein
LDSFFDENYGASYRYLEKVSTINRKFISKLHNGEIEESRICPIKLYTVLSKINPSQAIEIIFSKEEWGKKITNWKSLEKKQMLSSVSNSEIEAIVLENDYTATVFMLSLMPDGVTAETLIEMGGNLLISSAARLVSEDILHFDGERYVANALIGDGENKIFTFSQERLGSFISAANMHYNLNHSGQNRNFRFLNIGKVNKKYLNELTGDMEVFAQNAVTKSRLPENRGEIPMFLDMTMDTFIDKIDSDNEVLQ